MITKTKRKDVKKLIGDDIYSTELYYVLDQAADKIRAIYVLFGWSHMTNAMHDVDDLVLSLVSGCAKDLNDDPKSNQACHSSAGVSLTMYEDEGFINIELDFNII